MGLILNIIGFPYLSWVYRVLDKVTFGLVEMIAPELQYKLATINRSRYIFGGIFSDSFNPDRIVFSGDASVFDGLDVEVIADGLGFTEGPVWSEDEKALFFGSV